MTHPRTGEFVDLLPLTTEDAALTYAWRTSPRAVHLQRGAASVEQQAAWIASRPKDEHNFVIALKHGRKVGMVSLTAVEPTHRRAEPGRFLIGDEQAVRGIPAAVEAMKLIYELAFDELGLMRVYGTVASDNTQVIKWQKFLGMREEGRLRSHYFIDGHTQDAVVLGLLVHEYRQTTLPRMTALIRAGQPQLGA